MEEIATGVAGMMDVQPINVVGKDHPSKYEKQGKKREKKAQLNYKYMKIRNKKGKVMENLNEAVKLLEGIISGMTETPSSDFSTELKEELSERVQEIIEGRLWNEEEGRPTKEAGKLADKHKAIQKAVRRNADKNMQRAKKEEKEAGKEQKELESKRADAYKKSSDLGSKMTNAGDIYTATKDKHGFDHEATHQASANYSKAIDKYLSANKKAQKLSDKADKARDKKWAASDKYYDNYKKSNKAASKVNDLDAVKFRSTFSDK